MIDKKLRDRWDGFHKKIVDEYAVVKSHPRGIQEGFVEWCQRKHVTPGVRLKERFAKTDNPKVLIMDTLARYYLSPQWVFRIQPVGDDPVLCLERYKS